MKKIAFSIAIAIMAGLFTPALAQRQEPTDKHYKQLKYFETQRAFPLGHIPPGAFQAARQDYERKWGPRSQQAAPAIPQAAPAIGGNAWSAIGPDHISTSPTTTGRTNTIAIHPTNASIIYAGGAEGGVWKTIDGGATWTPLTDTQCSLAMGSIAIDPVNPNIVYAGTGEQNFSPENYYGCGVLRSADGGKTWMQLGASTFVGTPGQTISRLVIDPATAGSLTATRVLVAASSGVYLTTDSGSTWTQVLAASPSPVAATDLLLDPQTPSTLYAALGEIFGDASNGVYKSTNGGNSWTRLGGGFPTSDVGRINIGIAPSSPSTLYAGVQSVASFGLRGIWKSTNGGTSWTKVLATGVDCGNQCWYDMYIYVDPTTPNTVYFGGLGIYKSTNGGITFSEIAFGSGVHTDQHALAFQPGLASTIFAGSDGGIFKSTNSGSTWISLNSNYTTAQFYPGVALDPTSTSDAIGGLQDNDVVLYTGSGVWAPTGLCGDGGFTAIDFVTPGTKYAECEGGAAYSGPWRSDSGNSFVHKVSGINLNDAMLFIPPIAMSPTNSHTLYFGTTRLYKTTNRGDGWTAISPNGTDPISTVAEAKSSSQVVYVGTSNGNVQVTTNGGANWTQITTGLPSNYITYIAVDPGNSQNAFVTVSGFSSGHVFKTTNGGASWLDISGNLPDIPVNAIALDPGAPTANFYIGTDLGVFQTTDGGSSWAPFNNGLPNVAVLDLVFNQTLGVMVAATHGRGMWKLSFAAAPPNDNFANATAILAGQTLAGSNVNATKETGEPDHAGNIGGKSVWWSFTAPTSAPVTVSTANSAFDTLLAVYTGSAVNALTLIASNDDAGGRFQSSVTFSAVGGATYKIAVDGYNPGTGAVSGSVSLVVTEPLALAVSPFTDMAASGTQGGLFSPASFSYTLGATTGSVSYSITGVPTWLTPSSTSGTVTTSGTTVTFTVNASANSLAVGTYGPTTITFNNTTNGQGTQTRSATLTVSVPPLTLQVSPATNVSSSGNQGGPFSPSSFSYQLSATTGSIDYSISGLPSWLTASSTSGTVTASGTTVTIAVNTNARSLVQNAYNGTVTFTNSTNNQGSTTRTAQLTVNAQGPPATRAFVSGKGIDNGDCPLAAPCRTFAYAITQTNAHGEIAVLDTADYGPVTINKSISIVNPGGIEAAASALVGGTAVTINAGTSDVVALRGLTIEGAGSGQNGIVLNSGGNLEIESCFVRGFTGDGIDLGPTGTTVFRIANTVVSDNGGNGILIVPQGTGTAQGVIDNAVAHNNGSNGIVASGSATTGAVITATITNSIVSGHAGGVGIYSLSGTASVAVMAHRTSASQNLVGFGQSGSGGLLQLAKSRSTANGTGVVVNGGTIYSFGDNDIIGNTTNVSGSLTGVAKQ
jgi:hypothetical protein